MSAINSFLLKNNLRIAQNPCVSPDFCLDWPALQADLRAGRGREAAATVAAPAPPPTHPFTLLRVPPLLLILKTTPGFAQAMALALDQAALPSLGGTIAGDDTIFIAPSDTSLLDSLEREVRERLQMGI